MKKLAFIIVWIVSLAFLAGGCGRKEPSVIESSSVDGFGLVPEETKQQESEAADQDSESQSTCVSQTANSTEATAPTQSSSSGSQANPPQTVPISSAPAHIHDYQAVVVAPTCRTSGYTRYECACGEGYNSDFVARLEHTYSDWQVTIPPTYTTTGQKERICGGCGDSILCALPMLVNIPEAINEVVALVNQERAAAGLEPLTVRADLQNLAAERAVEIVTFYSHDRVEGKEPINDYFYKNGYRYGGENIARGQRSAQEVMNSWMNSPGHRQNILLSSYKYIGVGCYYTGVLDDMYTWVQVFGG